MDEMVLDLEEEEEEGMEEMVLDLEEEEGMEEMVLDLEEEEEGDGGDGPGPLGDEGSVASKVALNCCHMVDTLVWS